MSRLRQVTRLRSSLGNTPSIKAKALMAGMPKAQVCLGKASQLPVDSMRPSERPPFNAAVMSGHVRQVQ